MASGGESWPRDKGRCLQILAENVERGGHSKEKPSSTSVLLPKADRDRWQKTEGGRPRQPGKIFYPEDRKRHPRKNARLVLWAKATIAISKRRKGIPYRASSFYPRGEGRATKRSGELHSKALLFYKVRLPRPAGHGGIVKEEVFEGSFSSRNTSYYPYLGMHSPLCRRSDSLVFGS